MLITWTSSSDSLSCEISSIDSSDIFSGSEISSESSSELVSSFSSCWLELSVGAEIGEESDSSASSDSEISSEAVASSFAELETSSDDWSTETLSDWAEISSTACLFSSLNSLKIFFISSSWVAFWSFSVAWMSLLSAFSVRSSRDCRSLISFFLSDVFVEPSESLFRAKYSVKMRMIW